MEAARSVDAVVLVLPESSPPEDRSFGAFSKLISITPGGDTRLASVSEGMICLPGSTELVLVHDAVRPMVTPALIDATVNSVEEGWDGAVPSLPMQDAVKEVLSTGAVVRSVRRDQLFRVQTPQVFVREALEDSLARAAAEAWPADDCSEVVVRAGYQVRAVSGDRFNIKITHRGDLVFCETLLKARAQGSV